MKLDPKLVAKMVQNGATIGPAVNGGKWGGNVVVHLETQLKSELNQREHWAKKYQRAKKQKSQVAQALYGSPRPPAGSELDVYLLRLYANPGRPMDEGDNLNSAFKHCRDAVAAWLERSDSPDSGVTWHYSQKRAEFNGIMIRVCDKGQ